jgi:hypothetical protein
VAAFATVGASIIAPLVLTAAAASPTARFTDFAFMDKIPFLVGITDVRGGLPTPWRRAFRTASTPSRAVRQADGTNRAGFAP